MRIGKTLFVLVILFLIPFSVAQNGEPPLAPPEPPSTQIVTLLQNMQNQITTFQNQMVVFKESIQKDLNNMATMEETNEKFDEVNYKLDNKVGIIELIVINLITGIIIVGAIGYLKGTGKW